MVWGVKVWKRSAISCCFLAVIILSVVTRVQAQQPPASTDSQQAPPEQKPQPSSQDGQKPPTSEPGAGAQVQTGSVLGTSAQSLFQRLAALFADHQFLDAEQMLNDQNAAEEAHKLTPQQKQLYRGVLANRENQPEESVKLLEPLLAQIKSSEHPPEEKLLRKALAEDYLRLQDWPKANQAFLEYEFRFGGTMTPSERDDIELPLKLLPLTIDNPQMTVEPGKAFSLPYDRDALGLTDVPVFVDAQSHDWMLDPTSPFNLICRSTAKQIGLKVSDAAATVNTITGRPMQVHMTVIPRFTLGTVTFRNMTAFVFEDADYYFPGSAYQVRGVLGFPAVSALGSLTVTANSNIEVQPGPNAEKLTTGARFFLDGEQIITALGKPGAERMFVVDAGGQQTYLTSRYFAEHSTEFEGGKMQLLAVPGAQNHPPVPAYVAETLMLDIGNTPVAIHFAQVLTQPLDAAAIDDTYGTIGADTLDDVKSYTFDYRTMRFAVVNH